MEAPVRTRSFPHSADRFHGLEFQGTPSARRHNGKISVPSVPPWGAVAADPLEPGTPEEKAFLEFALARGRQSVGNYRLEPLLRRLPACLRTLKVDSLAAARSLLEERPEATVKALDALLIGATSFYRDAPVFDYLAESALPRLFASHDRVRILSAACSDGAELYTVAALVDQLGRLPDADLLGIDCRESALAKAREGRYADGAADQFPPSLLSSCLTRVGGRLHVREDLRAAANWAVGNAIFPSQHGKWNLILCRNLAIYLRSETCVMLWRHLALALEPGGYLVVGRAERPYAPGLIQVGPCTYRKDS